MTFSWMNFLSIIRTIRTSIYSWSYCCNKCLHQDRKRHTENILWILNEFVSVTNRLNVSETFYFHKRTSDTFFLKRYLMLFVLYIIWRWTDFDLYIQLWSAKIDVKKVWRYYYKKLDSNTTDINLIHNLFNCDKTPY